MKNIIVKGKPELRKSICQCNYCGCQFKYTDNEVYKKEPVGIINGPFKCVKCPWCLAEIKLTGWTTDETSRKSIGSYGI